MSYLIQSFFNKEKLQILSIVLIPLLLITGPFLPDLIIVILALTYLIKNIRDKNFYDLNKIKTAKILFIFWLWIIFISFFSDYVYISLKSSIPYLRFLLFSLFFYLVLKKYNKKILQNIFMLLTLIYVTLFCDTLLQFFSGKNIFGFVAQYPRMSSFFDEELILGSFSIRFYPFWLALFFISLNNQRGFLNLFIFFIVTTMVILLVILSGERTSVFFIFLILSCLLIFIKNFHKIKIFILINSMIIFAVVLFTDNIFKKRLIDDTIKDFNVSKNITEINLFSETYQSHYYSAIKIFKDNWFIGSGPNSFRKKCQEKKYYINEKSCSTHPHNIYVQLAAETGIFGLLFLILIFLNIILKLFSSLLKSSDKVNSNFHNAKIALLVSFLISTFPFIPSGNFFNNWISAVYYYPLGLYFWISNFESKKVNDIDFIKRS